MWKWARENATLLSGITGLVGFIVFAIFGFHEWRTDDSKYLRDGAFALFFLGLGLNQLWRWRQQQWERLECSSIT